MAFLVWLLSLSMFSRFIHIVVSVSASLLFMGKYYSSVWIDHVVFVCSLPVTLLGSVHLLTMLL